MDDLELIKQKINIVDLVQEYLPLKKAGVNFKAPCPFHQEKTPSFVVSPERGIFHCFGCNIGGDIFKFLMLKEGMEFVDALDFLAKKAGIVLKRQKSEVKDKRQRLFEANQKAAQYFNYILTSHTSGKKALEYLKNRGVTDETIKKFNLGYAPNSWESLTKFLKKRGFTITEMTEAGLIVSSKSSGYDRFRGRVMFPLVNIKDEVVGFSGRILGEGEPKYLNTPVTLIFDKTHFLFGLNLAKGEIRLKKQAVLVEGMMDMVMSYQSGVKNVVATQGTALTAEQIELIKKYTDTIALCFDKDLAGDSACRRGIEMADKAGLNIKVVEIEGSKDPAEIALKDFNLWQEAVDKAEPIYDYYLRSVSIRYNNNTADGKKKIGMELIPIWSKISDSFTFEHYLQKLSATLGINEEILRKEVKKAQLLTSSSYEVIIKQNDNVSKAPNRSRQDLLSEYLLALLLKIPENVTFVPNFPETIFISETFRSIYVLLVLFLDKIAFKGSAFDISEFIKTLPAELIPIVDRLYLLEIDDKLSSHQSWQEEVTTVVTELKKSLLKASLEKLSVQIKNAESFGKIETLDILNRRFRDLSVKLKSL